MRYLITFSYNGKNYNGYQKQPGLKTIQGEIEKALTFINGGKHVDITSSGRTDKGVHALGQTAHFDLDIDITLEKLKRAINSNTSDDIHVIKVKTVGNSFHARYDAVSKRYVYKLNMGEFNPLEQDYVYQYGKELDIEKMKKAISFFVGTHDYELFVGGDTEKTDYIRTIYKADIKKNKDIVEFIFEGSGFMQYQIRNMVGTLIKVGRNKIEPEIIQEMLNKKHKNLIYCAKSSGLCLIKVSYKKRISK